ncbi:hypothetical protein BB561_001111 [Smittium simulii]|uniref:Glycerol-3-phosphate dehydrogenase n=1 Tax=Smittium simulii TaxID=133385 RepID=A0A2T9YW30_9FUNG|nr:hypothetical protein BB561_001111 [Smittium simulii]
MFKNIKFSTRALTLSSAVAVSGISYALYSKNDRNSPKVSSLFLNKVYADSTNIATSSIEASLRRWKAPTRSQVIKQLKDSSQDELDLLIIGGGATGSGCAVDAAMRGLKVALVERDDFAAGTSSKSTKLVHGGVRYLQSAIMKLDYGQWKMVKEALFERKTFLDVAPHLTNELAILLPVYSWIKLPYYWVGCKMYDLVSGKHKITSSYLMSRDNTIANFPMLKHDGLVGSIVYYDGQQNDSRVNLALALTAAAKGALVANHVEVISLIKEQNELGASVVKGARVRDTETGEEWDIKSKGVINATGPFTDHIVKMDEPQLADLVVPSSGVHVILPSRFCPPNLGLLDAETSDGRVIFFLPWLGRIVAGTTDSKCDVEYNPKPAEEDIEFIVNEVNHYLDNTARVTRKDVLAAWSGIRPLVRDPKSSNTKDLVRNHMIYVSDSNLVTISGGKWTTYREMAQETVDTAIKAFGINNVSDCTTPSTKLIGGETWTPNLNIQLTGAFEADDDIATHLSTSYGDVAWAVPYADPNGPKNVNSRIHPKFPYIEADIHFAVDQEYARTTIDVFSRRLRLAFLDYKAALESLPKIISIMGDKLQWDNSKKLAQYDSAIEYLTTMGLSELNDKDDIKSIRNLVTSYKHSHPKPTSKPIDKLSYIDMGYLRSLFYNLDTQRSNFISTDSLLSFLNSENLEFSAISLDKLIKDSGVSKNTNEAGNIDFEAFVKIFKNAKDLSN